MAAAVQITVDDEDTSQLLRPYIQSGNLNFLLGSGASFPAITTAGNIEAEINAHLLLGEVADANLRAVELIEHIDGIHGSIPTAAPGTDIHNVTESYKTFLSIIDHILFVRKNILLPRQATVFTTNYDLFVEHASSLVPSVLLNDGFDRSSGLGLDFAFTPERYFDRTYRSGTVYSTQVEIPTVNLVKLHGSLSWRRGEDSVVYDPVPINSLTAAQKADPTQVDSYLRQHFLILPNLRKFHETLMERVYYDLLRQFSKAMEQENSVLMTFGFSFADEHILDITRRALRNPTAQLLIFAFDAASVAGYEEKFAKQRNVTILAPVPGSTLPFGEFNKLLASITAA